MNYGNILLNKQWKKIESATMEENRRRNITAARIFTISAHHSNKQQYLLMALNFNVSDYNSSLLPEGQYELMVSGIKEKPTKAGTGSYLQVEYVIVGGDSANMKIFDLININNPNSACERIGRARLCNLMCACGMEGITNASQLMGGRFTGIIGVKPGNNGYSDSNVVKKFLKLE